MLFIDHIFMSRMSDPFFRLSGIHACLIHVSSPSVLLKCFSTITMAVEISRSICIRGGGLGQFPWILQNSELVEGRELARLNLWSRGFIRFVFGAYTSNTKTMMLNSRYLDNLKADRHAVMHPTKCVTKYARRQAQMREKLMGNPSQLIKVIQSSFSFDGVVFGPIEILMKRPKRRSDALAVELTAEVFSFIRAAILAGGTKPPQPKKPRALKPPLKRGRDKVAEGSEVGGAKKDEETEEEAGDGNEG